MAELQRKEIIGRIRQARKEAGLSQPEMAELCEVATRTYQNYEDFRVPWGLLGRIGEAAGRPLGWMLHGDDNPTTETPDLLAALADLQAKTDEALRLLRRLEGERLPGPSDELLQPPAAPQPKPGTSRRARKRPAAGSQ